MANWQTKNEGADIEEAIGLLLTMLWLRPKSDVNFEKEWVSRCINA